MKRCVFWDDNLYYTNMSQIVFETLCFSRWNSLLHKHVTNHFWNVVFFEVEFFTTQTCHESFFETLCLSRWNSLLHKHVINRFLKRCVFRGGILYYTNMSQIVFWNVVFFEVEFFTTQTCHKSFFDTLWFKWFIPCKVNFENVDEISWYKKTQTYKQKMPSGEKGFLEPLDPI